MSNLTIDECRRIISEGRRQLTAAEGRIAVLESTVLKMYREHPIAQFEQWIEDLGLNEADAWNAVKR